MTILDWLIIAGDVAVLAAAVLWLRRRQRDMHQRMAERQLADETEAWLRDASREET